MHAGAIAAAALGWHAAEAALARFVPRPALGRAMGFAHASLALVLLLLLRRSAEAGAGTPLLVASAGYFVWELSSALRGAARGRADAEQFAHAIICGAGYIAVLQQPPGSRMLVYAERFLWFEASTPLLHASWAVHRWRPGSALALLAQLGFVASFVASRVCYGGWLTLRAFGEFDFWRGGAGETACLSLVALSAALNLYWLWRIARMCCRRCARCRSPKRA